MPVALEKVEYKIIDTARRLAALNGVSNVSVALLSKNLDFSKSNIYHYFVSKDQIFERLVEEQIDEFALVTSNDNNLQKIIDYLLEGDMFPGLHLNVLLGILQEYPANSIIQGNITRLFSDIQVAMSDTFILQKIYPKSLAD